MPIFKIEPVNIRTIGGYDAVITGIETDATDCIVGKFKAPAGDFDAKWDKMEHVVIEN